MVDGSHIPVPLDARGRSCAPAAAAAGAIRSSAIRRWCAATWSRSWCPGDAAREHYGVVLRDDLTLDETATNSGETG